MKPRAFIGSSVEGLSLAYAVQQNLLHDAEVTVWDQGVFKLSSTTIESLVKALSSTDFGIFVFSADDIVNIRDNVMSAVRDNVLFEMGLFIGKLGRERVFFLVPSGSDIHIASDLLGVTPAKYETNRSDGSLQAATAPACHQMREQIKKCGPISVGSQVPSAPESAGEAKTDENPWFQDFFGGRYGVARKKLEAVMSGESGETALGTQAWIYYCDLKEDEKVGLQELRDFAKAHPDSAMAQRTVAMVLRRERHVDEAIRLLLTAKAVFPDDHEIDVALSESYVLVEDADAAIAVLAAGSPESVPAVALALANIYEKQEKISQAVDVVHACFRTNPNDIELRFKYALLSIEAKEFAVALYLLNGLAQDDPESIEYQGYLGNACLALTLYDRALVAYRRAEELIAEAFHDQWIISNIGNLMFARGFHSEAIKYLERALRHEPSSVYAHDRLASALKASEEENREFQKKRAEGLKAVRDKFAKSIIPLAQ